MAADVEEALGRRDAIERPGPRTRHGHDLLDRTGVGALVRRLGRFACILARGALRAGIDASSTPGPKGRAPSPRSIRERTARRASRAPR
jgi:hypothetical protein